MRQVYDYPRYREFLSDWVSSRPSAGKGERTRLAGALRVHPSLITQILGGAKELTQEQAFLVAQYCGLTGAEREYFSDLVLWERAGDPNYKSWLAAKLQATRTRARPEGKPDLPAVLSEYERTIFYSTWYYSAVHLATALPGRWTVARIAKRLDLPQTTAREVLGFLVSAGLCVVDRDGSYRTGKKKTHLQDASTHLDRFLANWRLRGLEKIASSHAPQFFHSQQLYLSREQVEKVKALLAKVTAEVSEATGRGTPDTVFCLNIDWFET